MARRNPECGICETINTVATDDVTVIDDDRLSDRWRLALMENQGALGSMYITTREHRSDLDSLTEEETRDLMEIAQAMTKALKTAFHATHVNFACDMNDAAALHQPTHVHFKLRGRYEHTTVINDEEFSDTGFGTKHIKPHFVGRQTLRVIRNKIEDVYYGD